MRLRFTLALPLVAVAVVGWPGQAMAVETAADAVEFPVGYEGYRTYAEMNAEIDAAIAAYGQGPGAILARQLIGYSYEGREIVALKISDRVGSDESEPEVLSVSMVHAREHLTLEMNLHLLRLLTENYGQPGALGERVTSIVNTREIWLIPMANPDGAIYNISDGEFHGWRKNRQPNPGSTKIGTDINRNFGFMWNCCGGSSGNPGSARYRGPEPWSAPETRVLRDFVLGRIVNGRQQIKAIFNWHSYGQFVMWPFGYTKEDVPSTMTMDDHDALVAIGTEMAALNGYKPKQGSDSYIYDGDMMAWMYGDQRIVGFTLEMYPGWGCSGCGGFRPPDTVIERETTRNREAVLYFMEQADCVYRAAGLGATHCGPLNDDFETGRGWTLTGSWQRAIPQESSTAAGVKQRAGVTSGRMALVTRAAAGADANADDVDGSARARSSQFRLGAGASEVSFNFTFAHDATATTDDFLRLSVIRGTTVTPVWTELGVSAERNAAWQSATVDLSAFAGKQIRLLFEASDGGTDNLVEAAIDDVRVYRTP